MSAADAVLPAAVPPGAVVVGVDGSVHAERAMAWAAEEAEHRGVPLVLLHADLPLSTVNAVWLTSTGIDAAQLRRDGERAVRAVLDREAAALRSARPGLEVVVALCPDDPRQALVEASATAALVVVGSRGHGPVAGLLLGSVSTAVVRHASCPVLVVRPARTDHPRRGVLVGVDVAAPAPAVLAAAYAQAELRAQPLTVMHCFWDVRGTAHAARRVPADDHSVDDLRLLLAEATAGLAEAHPDVVVHHELARGFAEELLSRESGYDLVVVGHRRAGPLHTLLHGSVALAVVELASTPVLVVPLVDGGPTCSSSTR